MFDSHCHLDSPSFGNDLKHVIKRAQEAGVTGMVTLGCGANPRAMEEAVALAHEYPWIWAAVGVHPHEADAMTRESIAALERFLQDDAVVALGEIGLDYHYDFSSQAGQKKAFITQLGLAAEAQHPVVIHCRQAHEDCLDILSKQRLPTPPGIIHCYTEGPELAKRYIDLGFFISIPGVITFRNPGELLKTVQDIPIEHLLVETDAPYLAPHPHRGKRNEPAFLRHTIERIAQIKGLSFDDVSRITEGNARRIFGLPPSHAQQNNIAYPIRDSLYLNITNRCTLHCTFCHKWKDFEVKGHELKLDSEPTVQQIIEALEDADYARYREIVFCGYGEPLLRLDTVLEVSHWLKQRNMPVRINTDGLASLVHQKDVPLLLAGLVDSLSISLNAPDPKTYARICPSRHREEAHKAVMQFIKRAKENIPNVVASVVALPDLDLAECQRLAQEELGVELKIRPLDDLG